MPQGIEVRQGTAHPESGLVAQALLLGAGLYVEWDGFNDAGQAVDAGAYQMQITVRDPFGKTSSFAGAAQVLRSPVVYSIAVYNSSGERVKTLLPLGNQKAVSNFSLSSDVFSPDAGMPCVQVASGSTLLSCWDGSNDAGSPMGSGNYVVAVADSSGRMLVEKQLTVLRAGGAGELKLLASPNPLPPGAALRIQLDGAEAGRAVELAIYSLSGERVFSRVLPGQAGRIQLEAALSSLAPGIYICNAFQQGSLGTRRASVKIGILR
jgi:hypothetical protein